MKIVRIFEGQNCLLSFKYDNEDDDEYSRLFDLWNDTEYIYNFFEDNQEFLNDIYWSEKSIDELVLTTIDLAGKFENTLLEYENIEIEKQQKYLEEIFEPLSQSLYRESSLTKSKSKESWLRIYALKVNKSVFMITGGAIKLTQEMKDHELTNNELKKLEKCRNYLIDNGITDIEQIASI
jgi:hypothetical protein